jgi:hypothetical protein
MRYIDDIIGEEYKKWIYGTSVLIASQTGTGKTTFILEKLLANAIKYNKYLVYICNRRSLDKQMRSSVIEKVLSENPNLPSNARNHLIYTTYQECEKRREFPYITEYMVNHYDTMEGKYIAEHVRQEQKININPSQVMYYVFDEAHYFVSDAMFNENTNFWQPQHFKLFTSISVFLTATPEPLALYLSLSLYENKNEERTNQLLSSCFHDQQYYKQAGAMILKNRHKPFEELITYGSFIPLTGQFSKESIFGPIKFLCQIPQNTEIKYPINTEVLHFYNSEIVNEARRRTIAMRYRNAGILVGICRNDLYVKKNDFFSFPNQIYFNQNDYSYLDPWYFEDYCELQDQVIKSEEKWVFFVDNKRKGEKLKKYFLKQGKNAVFLCAKNRTKEGSDAQKTFQDIEKEQAFKCDILITTRVLDCGVSLTDPEIKNIVIDEKDVTEFIQMIGRRRCQGNDDRVRCFIKHTGNGEWHKALVTLERDLDFMSDFYNLQFPDTGIPQMNVNEYSVLSRFKNAKKGALVTLMPPINRYQAQYLDEYRVSVTAYINCIYNYYILQCAKQREKQTLYPFLEMQLNALGKEYDLKKWYGYELSLGKLQKIMEDSMAKGRMVGSDQDEFREKCLRAIAEFQKIHLPANMVKAIQKFEKYNPERDAFPLPSLQSLNATLIALRLPYQIRSKQGKKNNRAMQWWVEFADVEQLRREEEERTHVLNVLENGQKLQLIEGEIIPAYDREYEELKKKAEESGLTLEEYVKVKYNLKTKRKDIFVEVECWRKETE